MERAVTETVSCAEMKEIERQAAAAGLSYYQMMENAGRAAVDVIRKYCPVSGRKALVFCGKGNNGGDGFVAAHLLWRAGASVTVVLADGEPTTFDAVKNYALLQGQRIRVCRTGSSFTDPSAPDLALLSTEVDIIVDAIYGTGFHAPLKEHVRVCTRAINVAAGRVPIFALDVPSGLHGDLGQPDPDTVRADYTIAFHRCKPVHFLPEARPYCGLVIPVDIGIEQ